jgi:hypothetical protein
MGSIASSSGTGYASKERRAYAGDNSRSCCMALPCLLGFARQLYWLGGLHIAGTSYIGVYVAGCWDNMKDRHGWLLWDCCACGDDAARLRLRLRLGGGGG